MPRNDNRNKPAELRALMKIIRGALKNIRLKGIQIEVTYAGGDGRDKEILVQLGRKKKNIYVQYRTHWDGEKEGRTLTMVFGVAPATYHELNKVDFREEGAIDKFSAIYKEAVQWTASTMAEYDD